MHRARLTFQLVEAGCKQSTGKDVVVQKWLDSMRLADLLLDAGRVKYIP